MEGTTMVVPSICKSPEKKLHHKEGSHLLVFEDNIFYYVAVPPLPSSSISDPIGLCFSDHDDEWDSDLQHCCLNETGHVHAHYHHGDKREDILLQQCMAEAGCALPMSLDLPVTVVSDVPQSQVHEHKDGCGHNQIAHGDHFDWLIPVSDGSFLLSHVQITDSGAAQVIEHGRLVKVGECFGRLKRHTKQLFDLFGYESPQKIGYEMLPVMGEILKEDGFKSPRFLTDPVCSLLSSPEISKNSFRKDMVEVDLPHNLTNHTVIKTSLDVFGICCPSEVPLIKKILEPLPGVKEVSVNVTSKIVTVLHDPALTPEGKLVKVLNEARLDASIHDRGELKSSHRWPSPYTIVSGLLMVVAFFQYVFPPLKWVALGAVAAGLPPIIMRSLISMRRTVLDINVLMLIAVGGSIALGDYLEAGSIVFLFTLADWLESRSSDQARLAISAVMNLAPQTAVLASGVKVPVSEVKVGTMIAVKAGESIPIDGLVISGKSSVDESSLTGESIPVEKAAGSIVWAGTMNMSGYLCVETTALAEDSAVARMVRLVEDAQAQRSHSEQLVEQFAKYYTPFVVVTAIALVVVPLALRVHDFKHWLYLALVLLVVACPCALVISTPVTTTCGIAQAARMGLIIKGGSILESLGKLRVVALDKTGTLTEGHFRVAEVLTLKENITVEQLLYWISCVENKASHPMASAMVAYARLQGIEPSGDVDGFEILPGEGVSGIVEGHQIHIGNSRLATRLCWFEALNHSLAEKWSDHGATVCWVGVDEKPVGIFSVADQIRPEAEEAVRELKKLGIRVAMLTGDSEAAADSVHRLIGQVDVFSQLLPEDKVKVLKELKENGVTGMVGDGINDAPALAAADVGLAMGVAGSAVAMETADIALMTNDLRKVADAIKLGQKARIKIQQNVLLAFVTKALIIALAAVGYASLWAAVLADVGTCLIVVFNSMLLLKRKKTHRSHGGSHSHCQREENKGHHHCHKSDQTKGHHHCHHKNDHHNRCHQNDLSKGHHSCHQKNDHHNHGSSHQVHGHHCDHNQQKWKKCSNVGDSFSEATAMKSAVTSPCCKSGRDAQHGHDHHHHHHHNKERKNCCSKSIFAKLANRDCNSELTPQMDSSLCCESGRDAHHRHHHHEKLKDERKTCLLPTSAKPADTYREIHIQIDSPACCQPVASGHCCTSGHADDFTATSCCEGSGKSTSNGIGRRMECKETCTKDCERLDCLAVIDAADSGDPAGAPLNCGFRQKPFSADRSCTDSVEVALLARSCCNVDHLASFHWNKDNNVNSGSLGDCGACTKDCHVRDSLSGVGISDGQGSYTGAGLKHEAHCVAGSISSINDLSWKNMSFNTNSDSHECCRESFYGSFHSSMKEKQILQ